MHSIWGKVSYGGFMLVLCLCIARTSFVSVVEGARVCMNSYMKTEEERMTKYDPETGVRTFTDRFKYFQLNSILWIKNLEAFTKHVDFTNLDKREDKLAHVQVLLFSVMLHNEVFKLFDELLKTLKIKKIQESKTNFQLSKHDIMVIFYKVRKSSIAIRRIFSIIFPLLNATSTCIVQPWFNTFKEYEKLFTATKLDSGMVDAADVATVNVFLTDLFNELTDKKLSTLIIDDKKRNGAEESVKALRRAIDKLDSRDDSWISHEYSEFCDIPVELNTPDLAKTYAPCVVESISALMINMDVSMRSRPAKHLLADGVQETVSRGFDEVLSSFMAVADQYASSGCMTASVPTTSETPATPAPTQVVSYGIESECTTLVKTAITFISALKDKLVNNSVEKIATIRMQIGLENLVKALNSLTLVGSDDDALQGALFVASRHIFSVISLKHINFPPLMPSISNKSSTSSFFDQISSWIWILLLVLSLVTLVLTIFAVITVIRYSKKVNESKVEAC